MTQTKTLGLLSIVVGLTVCLFPGTAAAGPFSPPAWFSDGATYIKQHSPTASCEPVLAAPPFPDTWDFPISYFSDAGPIGCAFGRTKGSTPGSPTGSCDASNGHGTGDYFSCSIGVFLHSSAVSCSRMSSGDANGWQSFDPSAADPDIEHATLSGCLNSLDGMFAALSLPPKYSSGGPMKLAFTKPGKLVATDSWRSQCGNSGCPKNAKKKGYIHRMKSVKLTVTAASVRNIQIKPSKAGRKIFKASGKLQLAVDLKFTPAGGGRVRTFQRLMVLRKPR